MFRTLLALSLALLAMPLWAAPKNVVLFVADDLGLDAGCYGNRIVKTPHLDSLAAQGTRFTRAHCTTASCSASRSVILTGLYNHANGQYGHQHGEANFHTFARVRSLPLLLSAAGYRTCSIGKVHVQPEENYHFDHYLNENTFGGRHTVNMAENARKFITSSDERPFFLYFCTPDPHRSGRGFGNERAYPGLEEVTYDPGSIVVPHFLPNQPEVKQELAGYYQAISRMDAGLGRLIEVLKETGHWDDTLIIFASDNGMPFPGAKTTLYEPGTNLPLVIRRPGQQAGVINDALANWTDLVPTILEYAGAKGPQYKLHGRSLLPILEQTRPEGWDEIYASHTFHEITMYYPMRSVTSGRYKYILNLAHPLQFPFASDLYASKTWQGVLTRSDPLYGSRATEAYLFRPRHELYDLERDPRELVNLAKSSEHAEILAELQAKLKAWQEETGDPWAVKYRYE
jgi:N-sulfoglucosamine sulfohydrolase